ncbi:MAG: hypothetical protein AB1416_12025 [Actinomycetota bacterium]
MKVQYVGPHDGVLIPLPDGRELQVERDGIIDVPDELAARLLEQETNWQPAPAPARTGKAKTETPEPPAEKEE